MSACGRDFVPSTWRWRHWCRHWLTSSHQQWLTCPDADLLSRLLWSADHSPLNPHHYVNTIRSSRRSEIDIVQRSFKLRTSLFRLLCFIVVVLLDVFWHVRSETYRRTTERHLPYGIIPAVQHRWMRLALTPAKRPGTRVTYPGGMKG